ncbi:MAG: hypothetical protein ACP6IP_04570 [Candidatus Njordarchaeia archaeon]
MVIKLIKPEKMKSKRMSMFKRLISMIQFTIQERFLRSKLFLILYILYTMSVIVGVSMVIIVIDVVKFFPITDKPTALAVYFGLMLFTFEITLLNDLSFWLIAFSGSGVMSEELANSSIILFYTKPIPKYFYPISRFLSMFLIILIVAIIPIPIVSTIPFARNDVLRSYFTSMEIAYYAIMSLLSGVLVLSFYILFVYAVSSFVKDRGASVLISFITYYSTYIMGITLSLYVNKSFIVVSMPFWATSTLFVLMEIPWKNVDWSNLKRFFAFLVIGGVDQEPVMYIMGFSALLISIIITLAILLLKTRNIDIGGLRE